MNIFNTMLAREGKSFSDFSAIFDFGCGCGRLIRSLRAMAGPSAQLFGSDQDAEAIAWCTENISDATFYVNGEYPPLSFADASLDLIYACSVFTHIDAEHQFRWLAELQRVIKPGGYLLLTFRHKYNIDLIKDENIRNKIWSELERDGMCFMNTSANWKGAFPSWYGGAYHTPDYIRENWGRYFELIHIHDPIALVNQNTAVFRKKSSVLSQILKFNWR